MKKCFPLDFPKAKIEININEIFEKLDDAAVDDYIVCGAQVKQAMEK